jgi:hypothetical protein
MVTINDYLRKAIECRDLLQDETVRIIERNEDEIIKLNIDNIEQGEGSDGKLLKNSNPIFQGTYKLSTQLINQNKRAGDLYNFFDSGDFLGNFKVDVSSDLTKVFIYSTGTGSGQKADFFKGYNNLFGLDILGQKKLNYEIIKPQLLTFINKYI